MTKIDLAFPIQNLGLEAVEDVLEYSYHMSEIGGMITTADLDRLNRIDVSTLVQNLSLLCRHILTLNHIQESEPASG